MNNNPVVYAYVELQGGWWVVPFCPFCGKEHAHTGQLAGDRVPYCLPSAGHYVLTTDKALQGTPVA